MLFFLFVPLLPTPIQFTIVNNSDLDSFLADPFSLCYWQLLLVWLYAKSIRILHHTVALLFCATLLFYLAVPSPFPREPPDKDTSTLSSWILYHHTTQSCGLGGEVTDLEQTLTFPMYSPWRNPISDSNFEPSTPSCCGYPAALGLTLFSGSTLVCVTILMWFYNFFLKLGGTNWTTWIAKTCKQVFPTSLANIHLQDSYTTPTPTALPTKMIDAAKAAKAITPKSLHRKAKLLTAMAMLSTVAGQHQTFALKSDTNLRRDLRKHRLPNTGALGTNSLRPKVRQALLQRMFEQDNIFHEISKNEPNTYSTVLDTGASTSCVNDRNILVPGSLRRLKKPIKLDGIAGGHSVEYTGRVELETLDSNGNIFSIQMKVMLNEELPCILISP